MSKRAMISFMKKIETSPKNTTTKIKKLKKQTRNILNNDVKMTSDTSVRYQINSEF